MNNDTLGAVFDARNNSMNIMRLLAALAVIYGHASAVTGRGPGDLFLQFVGYKFIGGVAVDVFFVLSGFLITASAMSGKGIRYFVVSTPPLRCGLGPNPHVSSILPGGRSIR